MKAADLVMGEDYAVKRLRRTQRGRCVAIHRDFTATTQLGEKSTGLWVEMVIYDVNGPETAYVKPKQIVALWAEERDRRQELRRASMERLQARHQGDAMSRAVQTALQVAGFPVQVNATGLGQRVTVQMDMETANRLVSWVQDHTNCQLQV